MTRSFLAPVLVLLAGAAPCPEPAAAQPLPEAQRRLAEGQAALAVPLLVQEFAADPGSPEGIQVLWELARGAAPRPEVMEAVAAAADRLGADGWLAAGVLRRRGLRPLDALEAFGPSGEREVSG